MENNHDINQFDSALRQSLEGAQMPVPSGVWEAVGTSVGVKTIIAAKVAGIKLLVVKSIAALFIAGGAGWGVYEILSSDKTPELKTTNTSSPTQNYESPVTEENLSNPVQSSPNVVDPTPIAMPLKREGDSLDKNDLTPQDVYKDTFTQVTKVNTPESSPAIKKEEAITKKEIKTSETAKGKITGETGEEISKPEENYKPLEIPNIFTPYDIDEKNDCFKIPIENETKFFLQIFSGNGVKVFETTDKNNCWNGTDKNTGQLCPRGFYSYKLMYELKSGYRRTIHDQVNLR